MFLSPLYPGSWMTKTFSDSRDDIGVWSEDSVIPLVAMIALSKYYAIETDHLTSVLFSRADCVTE